MTDLDPREPAPVEEVAHIALGVGRVLFHNGADTTAVHESVMRFAAAFGCEAHLLVTYEALLLTASAGGQFRTKIGQHAPAPGVNLAAVAAVNRLVEEVDARRKTLAEARADLGSIERSSPVYGRWTVAVMLGLTAASLSRLFGGDGPTFGVVWVAGTAGTRLRQELARRGLNPFFVAFAGAFASGVLGAAAVLMGASGNPALCLVAPGMIIMPGVPLVNGVLDMIKNHMTTGLARLGLGGLITLSIAFGLFLATAATGVRIPVEATERLFPVPEDALFSALAALGYVFLFNVPIPIAWACVVCGTASHTMRTLCLHLGVDGVSGTLIGATAAGLLARVFARRFDAPAVAFAFPGVVAMVPGAFAFRFVIGCLKIVADGAAADASLVAETLALGLTCLLMVAAIAVGMAAPLTLFVHGRNRAVAQDGRATGPG